MVKFYKVNKPALTFVNKFYEYCTDKKKSPLNYVYAVTLKAKEKKDEYAFKVFIDKIAYEFKIGLFHMHYTYELDKDGMTHLHGILITKNKITMASKEAFMEMKEFFEFHFDLSKVKSPAWVKYMLKDQSSVNCMEFLRFHKKKEVCITSDPIMNGDLLDRSIFEYMEDPGYIDFEDYMSSIHYEL